MENIIINHSQAGILCLGFLQSINLIVFQSNLHYSIFSNLMINKCSTYSFIMVQFYKVLFPRLPLYPDTLGFILLQTPSCLLMTSKLW